MPILSPDGRNFVAGVGAGQVRINNVIPPALASMVGGGWAWRDSDRICGNGNNAPGVPENEWHLYQYTLSTGQVDRLDNRPASWTYGGGGEWVCYIASNPPFSFGSSGITYNGLVAFGCSPTGTYLFTNPNHDTLYWAGNVVGGLSVESVQIGVNDIILVWGSGRFRTWGEAAPMAPASGGVGARFAQRGGQLWLCQWNVALNGLVVYPWQAAGDLIGYVLSTDEKDFNHDIAVTANGWLVVATGMNQGETVSRYYELDLDASQFRVSGGVWAPLTPVSMNAGVPTGDPAIPPNAPIVTIPGYQPPPQASYGRRGYSGPYFATDLRNKGYGTTPGDFATAGNCEMVVNGTVTGGNQKVDRPFFVSLSSVGNPVDKMLGFLAGGNDNSMGNAGLKACHQWALANGYPKSLMVRYFDATPMPQDFINQCEREAVVQVQCYPRAGEGVSAAMARFTESVDRVIASGRKCGIARGFNTKYGGLNTVLGVQDPLCAMIRNRPAIILDAWFSHGRWYSGVESGAAYCAELLAWEPILAGLFTGLP